MRTRLLVMLRHGQTAFNLDTRMQGQLDTELSDLGRAQAVAAAEVLGKRQPLLIVSSDLRRAYDTAVVLAERTGLQPRVDARLRETHLGDWQGMTHAQVDSAAPGHGWPGARTLPGPPWRGEQGRGCRPQPAADRRVGGGRIGVGSRRAASGAGGARRFDRRVDRDAAAVAGGQLARPGWDGQCQLDTVERIFRRRCRHGRHHVASGRVERLGAGSGRWLLSGDPSC
ncbi:histidine phosphatase super family protein [Mycobacterium xenopi 4042]|uniref:Histidine phosphatase super family protein n=1 Tax=Mycobacterium xenopi 4042 TaxID=1299334 RepID=X8AMW7_MYCXE|nr:histidine phosphatase super family protein [Mycobacterium xenopi 4042]